MARVLVIDLDDKTVERLKARASRNGHSVEDELRMLIERAVAFDVADSRTAAARIRSMLTSRKHSDSAALLAADRLR